MKKLLQSKRRGSATAFAVFAVMLLLVMGVGLLSLGTNSRIYSIRNVSDIKARCAADAGMTTALFLMNEKLKVKPWNGNDLPEAATNVSLLSCDAVYSYTITGDSDIYTIQSTGTSSEATKTITCTLQLMGPFDAALFCKENLYMRNGGTVDWYNYDDDDRNMKVGTNSSEPSSIILKNSSNINGDIVVGMGGDPDVVVEDNGANITGQIKVLNENIPLPTITAPEWLESLISGGTIDEDTTINASGKYDSIDLGNSETVTISGDITLYITGDITFGNAAELQIEEGSSLTLYIDGNIEQKNSSAINNLTQDPGKLTIYGLENCVAIEFKNSSDLYGAIYAPNADIIVHNSADMYGSVVAQNFEQNNSSTFYYDASLRDASIDDEAMRFVITNWHEE